MPPLARRGFTMVELLISVTIISLSLLPIFYMAQRNVETARIDRVRVFAESLCHNTLERFGRGEDCIVRYLTQNPINPQVWEGGKLWDTSSLLADHLGVGAAQDLIQRHAIEMKVQLTVDVVQQMDLLICRVSWIADRGSSRKRDSVAYARYVLRDHVH